MLRRSLATLRYAVLAVLVGIVGGLVSALFIGSLNCATTARLNHDWLIWLMPMGGLLVGIAYNYFGSSITAGNNLVLDQIHEPSAGVPSRMAPMVYGASVTSHLVGASVGREGAAVQITASLADTLVRRMNPTATMRKIVLVSAVAAGFGAMFGVPIAGAIFALEVLQRGRPKFALLGYALLASFVGDRIVRALDVHHLVTPNTPNVSLDFALLWRLPIAVCVFALTAIAFIKLTHVIKDQMASKIRWAQFRPFIGGLVVLGLVLAAGTRSYLGLSTDIAEVALAGAVGLSAVACVWKFFFTTISLGTGFIGGEVLPVFIIGALVGAQTGRVLDAPVALFAMLGFVGVFSAAANTPIACIFIGWELFGANALIPIAIVCVSTYAISGSTSIYSAQRP
jgi:H+/Cl- antiporter ClcA